MDIQQLDCCGISELQGIGDHEGNSEEIIRELYDFTDGFDAVKTFYLFSAVLRHANGGNRLTYGPKFAAYITKHKLGTLVETAAHPNRTGGGNTIKAWIWHPNLTALRGWAKANIDRESRANMRRSNDDYYPY